MMELLSSTVFFSPFSDVTFLLPYYVRMNSVKPYGKIARGLLNSLLYLSAFLSFSPVLILWHGHCLHRSILY
jgi:hypothetical protein